MNELQVGDWTVIEDQIMEVTGFASDGTVIVRPLAPSSEMAPTVHAGWAAEGVPPLVMPVRINPLLNIEANYREQIAEAMRLARANPGREIIFGTPQDEPEDP